MQIRFVSEIDVEAEAVQVVPKERWSIRCVIKLEIKLQSIIANLLTEVRALIWIVWRDIKI